VNAFRPFESFKNETETFMFNRRDIVVTGLGAALGLPPGHAQSAWPEKPVKVVVFLPAGGASDVLTRLLAEKLASYFNQTFTIENKTGAGGNIGMVAVMNSAADGYTMGSATIGTLSINQFLYSKLGYEPAKDFAPVSTFWENCNVFAVSADHPAKTLEEFKTWAKAQPKGVTFSSSGVGTTPHLAGEMFGLKSGIQVVHVPFRGSANTEVIAGTIDFAIDNLASYSSLLRAGRARALAVTSADRWPTFPQVPTMAEAGIPDFVITSWGAMVMPGATSPAITTKLSKAIQDILSQPAMKERFLQAGARAIYASPADTAAFAAAERLKWKEVVRLSGAKLD
jgi:tripartite-type tricarboxylate transporter receptor subunit TctC